MSDDKARSAYDAYAQAVGHKDHTGNPLPPDFSGLPDAHQKAWQQVVTSVEQAHGDTGKSKLGDPQK